MHVMPKDTREPQIQPLFQLTHEFSMSQLIWVKDIIQISLETDMAYEIRQDAAELCILTTAKGCIQLREFSGKLHQGQSILLSPESIGHTISTTDAAAQCIVVRLKGGLLGAIQNENIFCPKGLTDIRECIRNVSRSTSDEQLSSAAYRLMMQLHENAQVFVETEGLPLLAQAAVGIIQDEFAQIYGVGEVAERLNVSTEHLTRIFSKALGISPGKFLRRRKLECAKELLKQPDITVALAAQLSGFTDVNYFSRVFQKEVGMLPSAYHGSHHAADPSEDIRVMIDTMYL